VHCDTERERENRKEKKGGKLYSVLLLLPLSRVLCGCDIDVITDFSWVTQKANRHTKHNGNVDANRVYTENLATSVHCRYSF